MGVFDSIDDMLDSAATNSPVIRSYYSRSGTPTSATTGSGYVTGCRLPATITIPSVGGGLTGLVCPTIRMWPPSVGQMCLAALEYELGVLTVSGNSFAAGTASAMPTKTIAGSSVTTASVIPVIACTVAVTATTPTLTITYTDQDGNTGQTATLTLPTNPAINTAFLVMPHLASGDTGWRDVTNMSISTGSAGTIRAYGLLPLAHSSRGSVTSAGFYDLIPSTLPAFLCEAGEVIGFYAFGTTGQNVELFAFLYGLADA